MRNINDIMAIKKAKHETINILEIIEIAKAAKSLNLLNDVINGRNITPSCQISIRRSARSDVRLVMGCDQIIYMLILTTMRTRRILSAF